MLKDSYNHRNATLKGGKALLMFVINMQICRYNVFTMIKAIS